MSNRTGPPSHRLLRGSRPGERARAAVAAGVTGLAALCAGCGSPQGSDDAPVQPPPDGQTILPTPDSGGSAGAPSMPPANDAPRGPREQDVPVRPGDGLPDDPLPSDAPPDDTQSPPEQDPPDDEPLEPLPGEIGTWRGLTGQNGTFSFVLDPDGISSITFEWNVVGCAGLSSPPLPQPVRPAMGGFEIETRGGPGGVSARFAGEFETRTSARGSATYEVIPSAEGGACQGTAETTWTASLTP